MSDPEPRPSPGDGRLSVAFWVALAGLAAVLVHLTYKHAYYSGDSSIVARGGKPIVACLGAGTFSSCPNVPHFPPLQLLVAAGLSAVALSDDEIYLFLGELNLWAAALVLVLAGRFFHARAKGRAFLFVALFVGGYSINYAVTSFGEMLGVLLGTWLVISAQRAQVAQAAIAAALLGLTKDVAAPLAIAMGIAALPTVAGEAWRGWLRRSWRNALLISVGAGAGAVASLTFNVFRYGTITNTYLLDEKLQVHSVWQQLLHLVALFASPAGGLAIVAPLSMIVIGVTAAHAPRDMRTPLGLQRAWPAIFTVLVSFGLARWFTPFGWWAWGPRLSLPWLVPAVVLAVAVAPPGAFEGRWRWVIWALGPLAVLNGGHLALPETMFAYFGSHSCPDPIGTDAFFECLNVMLADGRTGLVAEVAKTLVQLKVASVAFLLLLVVVAALFRWSRADPEALR
jgi:hypothetical protein